ncbi:MAG: acyltransferase family protein [Hyphomonas sp.]
MNSAAKIDNRFDLLRFAFAGLVMVYHAIALSGLAAGSRVELALSYFAEMSIQGFFILSGALVAGSLERSGSLVEYAMKRVRRLYPAYVVVILIPAAIALSFSGSFADVARYVGANLIFLNFLEPNLPGLFEDNRFMAVNGALWTLKIEVMFYACLPVLIWTMRRFGRWWPMFLIGLYVGGEAWRICTPILVDGAMGSAIARQLPGQMAYFACGIGMWKLWQGMPRLSFGVMICGIVATGVTLWFPALSVLRPLAWACAIAGVAFLPGWKPAISRFGDVSYGLYITHFPIIQTMVAAGVFGVLGLWGGVIVAAVLVLVASFVLWHMVEKRALRPTSYYRLS